MRVKFRVQYSQDYEYHSLFSHKIPHELAEIVVIC